MKLVKQILFGILIVAVLGALGFVFWANDIAAPSNVALKALQSDSQVTVAQHDGFITFEPAAMRTTTGLLFYPGGRIDYRASAPVLRKIAAQGYFVALIRVRLNLAFFDTNAADKVIAKYPEIKQWAIGGHSLGGVAAASYAKDHQPAIRAIAFWAPYPDDDSLKDSKLLVLSLYASNDGLATGDKIAASKTLLPTHTQYVLIEGGNHSQFGSYGTQAGDNPAALSAEEQWTQAADATVRLLASLLK